MGTLVICEKANAARRIAQVLSDGSARSNTEYKVTYFTFDMDGEEYFIIGLRGHILALDFEKKYNNWERVDPRKLIYVDPIKNVQARNIAAVLDDLVTRTNSYIIATDYDREGELIGMEALELIDSKLKGSGPENLPAKRAKFSALTNEEISSAFKDLKPIDFNLARSAMTRQVIDLVWGATLTRMISLSSRSVGEDYLSVGRVQTPTLSLIVDLEKKIQAFKPTPYWEMDTLVEKSVDKQVSSFRIKNKRGRMKDQKLAEEVFSTIKDAKTATIADIRFKTKRERAPTPFNTTELLRVVTGFGIPAATAMRIAEDLYTNGYISYPRTDNTVYPKSLDLKGIVQGLTGHPMYANYCVDKLVGKAFKATRGKTETTDHPPIHPTGVLPEGKLTRDQERVYDIVVRRFLATLSEASEGEVMEVDLEIGEEQFGCEGFRTIKKGWKAIYPFGLRQERDLPALVKGEELVVGSMELNEDETKPPSRFTQGKLIQEMEKLGLGTKSTRHEIIQKLYDRQYIQGKSPTPTKTGMAVSSALRAHAESITKSEMTSTLEADMDNIAEGRKDMDAVIDISKTMLEKIMDNLEEARTEVGKEITSAMNEQNMMGACPVCSKNLIIKRSRKGKRFIGCEGYPNCSNSYPLPQTGRARYQGEACKEAYPEDVGEHRKDEVCGAPLVVVYQGRKPWNLCANMQCPGREKERAERAASGGGYRKGGYQKGGYRKGGYQKGGYKKAGAGSKDAEAAPAKDAPLKATTGSTAAKNAPAKSSSTKKAPAKSSTTKKAPAKSSTTKKAPAKSSTTKKAPAKSTTTKKAPVKK